MASATPAREDIDALVRLTGLIVDAAAITRFLAQRWNLPALADSLNDVGGRAHDPSSSSSPSLSLNQRAQTQQGNPPLSTSGGERGAGHTSASAPGTGSGHGSSNIEWRANPNVHPHSGPGPNGQHHQHQNQPYPSPHSAQPHGPATPYGSLAGYQQGPPPTSSQQRDQQRRDDRRGSGPGQSQHQHAHYPPSHPQSHSQSQPSRRQTSSTSPTLSRAPIRAKREEPDAESDAMMPDSAADGEGEVDVDALGEMDPDAEIDADGEGEDELREEGSGRGAHSLHQQQYHQHSSSFAPPSNSGSRSYYPNSNQNQTHGHAQRNNSNQHGQMRVLANHRAPLPLDVSGSGGPGPEDGDGRDDRHLNRYMSAPSLGGPLAPRGREGEGVMDQDRYPVVPSHSGQHSQYSSHSHSQPHQGAGPPPPRAYSTNALGGSQPGPNGGPSSSSSQNSLPAPSSSQPSSKDPNSKPNWPSHTRRGLVPLSERHCSECGKPGRFKDGRSVEKWGPGPEGPGTVCDKCRKKMKRLDRKGAQAQAQQVQTQQGGQQRPSPIDPSTSPHTGLISPGIPATINKEVIMARYDPARTDYRNYPPPGLNDTPLSTSNARPMSHSVSRERLSASATMSAPKSAGAGKTGMDELGVLVEAADAMPSRGGSAGSVTPSGHGPSVPPPRPRGQEDTDADGDLDLDERDADGEGSGDGEGEEDDLIAAWEGSGSGSGSAAGTQAQAGKNSGAGSGNTKGEWATQQHQPHRPVSGPNLYNNPPPHQQQTQHPQPLQAIHPHHSPVQPHQHRGIPVSDIRSSSSMDTIHPPTRGATASPANGYGFSFGGTGGQTPRTQSQAQIAYDSHPAKRAKMDEYNSRAGSEVGPSRTGSGQAKEKPRKRAPSFSPSPPGSPRARPTIVTRPSAHDAPSYSNGHRFQSDRPSPAYARSPPPVHSASPPATATASARSKRPSLQAMNMSSPDADNFKPNDFPPTPPVPVHTLSTGSILGKRPRPSSASLADEDIRLDLDLGDGEIDDVLLEAASGSRSGSGGPRANGNARYYGQGRTSVSMSSGSNSGSRSPSPGLVTMHSGGVRMKPASSLRAAVGVTE